jgi:hypothetical protein
MKKKKHNLEQDAILQDQKFAAWKKSLHRHKTLLGAVKSIFKQT